MRMTGITLCWALAVLLTPHVTTAYAMRPNCHSAFVKVPVNATNYAVDDVIRVNNNIDAVNFALDLERWSTPNVTARITKDISIQQSFSIHAQICHPDPTKDKHIIQILTHGAIFDSRYWDVKIDPTQYSYVQAALDAGYTVLNYDRLGTGLSDKPNAYTVVQGPTEVEILRVLTEMARDGTVPGLEAFDNIIHIGHSYGSQITAALLTKYGNISSGAILTGFIFTTQSPPTPPASLGLQYAAENNPSLFGDFGSGYLVPATISNIQNAFYHRFNESDPSGFSNEILAYGASVKQPLSVGQALSIFGLLDIGYAPDFTGPLQFFLAEYDFLSCGGDCRNDYDQAETKKLYPNATDVDIYTQPGAGHGLTVHRNASAGYMVMFNWLNSNGL